MKTYFKYEGIIKSKEAAEAIAAPSGLGPFCGFGSATINGNKLVVSPQGVAGSKYANVIKDRIMARYRRFAHYGSLERKELCSRMGWRRHQ